MQRIFTLVVILFLTIATTIYGAGISVDAGLTPPEDRWIIRTQIRYMRRIDDPTLMDRKMSMYMFPTIVAYGLTPDLTLLVRQTLKDQKMSMAGSTDRNTGFDNLFILGKYKIYRRNTPEYTFGIAGTLGLEAPTGTDSMTLETWDLQPGLYTSWRRGSWATDFNMAYKWNGFAGEDENDVDPGDEFSLDWALAYQHSVTDNADTSLAPVLEISYKNISPNQFHRRDVLNTGESVLYLSPGIKLTISSFIIEALVQVPIWQDQKGTQLERDTGIIIGSRLMF